MSLYALDKEGKLNPITGWRAWLLDYGKPVLVAAIVFAVWHVFQDHAMLHRVPPTIEKMSQLVDAELTKLKDSTAGTKSTTDELAKRMESAETRLKGIENTIKDR